MARRRRNEPETIVHSEYSKESRTPALACLITIASPAIKCPYRRQFCLGEDGQAGDIQSV